MPSVTQHDLERPLRQFMQTVDTTVRSDATTSQAIAALRHQNIRTKAIYFYVIDPADRLVGVVSTRALLLAGPDDRIDRIMNPNVLSVPSEGTLQLAMEMFAMHRLLALPVVDDNGRLIGQLDVQLYTDEVFDLAETRRAADMFQLIGLSVEQLREGSAVQSYRSRLPWLSCNLFGGIACAVIAAVFDDVLEQVIILAMFIPLVLALSESLSIQAVTMGLQQLQGKSVNWARIRIRLTREWKTAAMLGLTLGLTVGLLALAWRQGWQAPGVIAASILLSMIAAATLGTAIPATLHALRLDPRLAAGPVVLTLTDITTMTVYLGLATLTLL
jgi:magnesium transporter